MAGLALGKEGQRALLLRQMMDTSNKPKAARTGGSNALSAATGSFPRFGTQAGWGYPQQPPPVYQPQPQWGGYGGGYY